LNLGLLQIESATNGERWKVTDMYVIDMIYTMFRLQISPRDMGPPTDSVKAKALLLNSNNQYLWLLQAHRKQGDFKRARN
jgi:hypothetical protein